MKLPEDWEIQELLISQRNGVPYDLEHVTDDEFQQFVLRSGIPVKRTAIVEWCFDDRIGLVKYAMRKGLKLVVMAPLPNSLTEFSEFFEIKNSENEPQHVESDELHVHEREDESK